MKAHLEREIENLKLMLSRLAASAEEAVQKAVRSVEAADSVLAREVIANDEALDRAEVEIEEECLKILALYQPVAGDLRYVITLLKVNAELERIGDLAANIAERLLNLEAVDPCPEKLDFSEMFFEVRSMLKSALDALIGRNSMTALEVIRHDDVVDGIHRRNYLRSVELARKYPETADFSLTMMTISRNLERIADCATNICEDVIYLEQGRIVRHSGLAKEEK